MNSTDIARQISDTPAVHARNHVGSNQTPPRTRARVEMHLRDLPTPTSSVPSVLWLPSILDPPQGRLTTRARRTARARVAPKPDLARSFQDRRGIVRCPQPGRPSIGTDCPSC